MIEFENPAAFFFLIAIPLVYFLRYVHLFSRTTFPLILGDWNGAEFDYRNGMRKSLSIVCECIMSAAFLMIVIALADPVKLSQKKLYSSYGTDIVFVVDTSPSMGGKDMDESTRIDVTKKMIKNLANNNSGSFFGLVEMGRYAVLTVPPTLDRPALIEGVDNIVLGDMGDGTAIGTGISSAIYHLESSHAQKKAIVLITDGENNAGELHPWTAAKMARKKGISLYVIALGTKGTVALEYRDPKTGHTYSGFMESNVDTASLAKIAAEGDGRFYEVATTAELAQVLDTIQQNENVVQSYHIKSVKKGYANLFLYIGLGLIVMGWILKRFVLKEVL